MVEECALFLLRPHFAPRWNGDRWLAHAGEAKSLTALKTCRIKPVIAMLKRVHQIVWAAGTRIEW